MNMSLAFSSASPQLRVNFTFDCPGGILMELKIESAVADAGPRGSLIEFYKMFDNLKYSQSGFTSCAECDRHQVLAILRRSIERARQSQAPASISVSIKDETGTIRNITVTDGGNNGMLELEKMLRMVASDYPGHAHNGPAEPAGKPRDLSVH
jgi:hypothetical protein